MIISTTLTKFRFAVTTFSTNPLSTTSVFVGTSSITLSAPIVAEAIASFTRGTTPTSPMCTVIYPTFIYNL